MSAHPTHDSHDHGHGHEASHGSFKSDMIGFVLSLILTAIPFWLDGIEVEWNGRHRPVSEHTINIYDYVALMDYRDKAEGRDSILSHASSEIAYANEVGKKVVIGLEVSSNDINKVTFHEEGPKVFEQEVRKVERALRNEPSFDGFAIHHYRAYRRWAGQYWE